MLQMLFHHIMDITGAKCGEQAPSCNQKEKKDIYRKTTDGPSQGGGHKLALGCSKQVLSGEDYSSPIPN